VADGPAARAALRPAKPGDLAAVRELLGASGLPLDGLEDQFGAGYVVAVEAGAVVGVAGLEVHGGAGLLRSVAVHRTHRGTGLGVALVKDRLDWARFSAVGAIYLLTTTAAHFFTRFGFVQVARESAPAALQASPEFATVCPGDSVCMRLDFAP
jgi:amino-acid N-acetyltransferase